MLKNKYVKWGGIGCLGILVLGFIGSLLTSGEQLSQEDQLTTAVAALQTENAPTATTVSTETLMKTDFPIVHFICQECIQNEPHISIILWESIDNQGNYRPVVSHGDQCQLLDRAMSTNGIEKVEIRCPAGQGWVRADAISERCVPATALQLETIQDGIDDIDVNNYVREGWAVKSSDFEDIWFVAANIYAPSMESGVGPGLWAIGGSSNMIMSANSFAMQFSPYPDGATTDANITQFDDGAQEALACASQ